LKNKLNFEKHDKINEKCLSSLYSVSNAMSVVNIVKHLCLFLLYSISSQWYLKLNDGIEFSNSILP